MNIGDWLKRKLAIIAMATANVEKSAFNNTGAMMSDNIGQERRLSQDRLADALVKGEVTEEVKNLRWRMYKILNQVSGSKVKFAGYDTDSEGDQIYKTTYEKASKALRKTKLDEFDTYEAEMIIINEPITISISDAMLPEGIEDRNESYKDEDGAEARTIGSISGEELHSQIKPSFSVMVNREFPSKIDIEKYTEKLVVRKIDEETRLLEFYISKYADETDRKTYLLISEIKRGMANPRATNIFDITEVGFETSVSSLGVEDNLIFEYKVEKFDKAIEFSGYYVIKFIAKVLVAGENMFDQYRMEELDTKYEEKAKKDI